MFPNLQPMVDDTRGSKKAWVIRRIDDTLDPPQYVYWVDHKTGYGSIAQAALYDKKPPGMGDEEVVQVNVEISLD